MQPNMFPKRGTIRKGFVTVLTLIWFYSCMYSVVDLKLWVRNKELATMLALISLNFCTDTTMIYKTMLCGKGFSTVLALKRLFSCVYPVVDCQIIFSNERHTTVLTVIRFFSSVSPVMYLKVIFRKWFVTILTMVQIFWFMSLCIIQNNMILLREGSGTILNLMWFLHCVYWHMLHQTITAREAIAAVLTMEWFTSCYVDRKWFDTKLIWM